MLNFGVRIESDVDGSGSDDGSLMSYASWVYLVDTINLNAFGLPALGVSVVGKKNARTGIGLIFSEPSEAKV